MAESENNGGDQQQQQQQAQRPEYIPEKFWDAEKSAPRVEDLGKGYAELSTKLGKAKEVFETERLANRPAKADDYKVAIPEKGPLAERFSKNNLVLLDKAPDKDFKPEAGKKYFQLDHKSPMLAYWRQTAHAQGLSNEQFMEGVASYAEDLMSKQVTPEAIAEEIAGEHKKLGEHGRERADFAYDKLTALIGDKAKAFDYIKVDAAGTEAIEALLEKLGQPKFSPGAANAGGGNVSGSEALAEAKKIQSHADYWKDPAMQAKAAELYKKAFPE